MTRDLSREWAAVFAAAYVAETRSREEGRVDLIDTDAERDEVAGYARAIADQAIAALSRVEAEREVSGG